MHELLDTVRDTLSIIFAGLFMLGVRWLVGYKKRLDRIAVEVRHTQKETNTEPFYEGDL